MCRYIFISYNATPILYFRQSDKYGKFAIISKGDEKIMDDYRQQQVEALQAAHEYSAKIINGINNVKAELRGGRLLDTDEYLKEIVNGINWLIEVTNRTMDVINENEVLIDKEQVNEAVKELGTALSKKDDELIAGALETGVLDFLKTLEAATAGY